MTLQGSSTFTAELMYEYRAEVEALSGQSLRVVSNKSAAGLIALVLQPDLDVVPLRR